MLVLWVAHNVLQAIIVIQLQVVRLHVHLVSTLLRELLHAQPAQLAIHVWILLPALLPAMLANTVTKVPTLVFPALPDMNALIPRLLPRLVLPGSMPSRVQMLAQNARRVTRVRLRPSFLLHVRPVITQPQAQCHARPALLDPTVPVVFWPIVRLVITVLNLNLPAPLVLLDLNAQMHQLLLLSAPMDHILWVAPTLAPNVLLDTSVLTKTVPLLSNAPAELIQQVVSQRVPCVRLARSVQTQTKTLRLHALVALGPLVVKLHVRLARLAWPAPRPMALQMKCVTLAHTPLRAVPPVPLVLQDSIVRTPTLTPKQSVQMALTQSVVPMLVPTVHLAWLVQTRR